MNFKIVIAAAIISTSFSAQAFASNGKNTGKPSNDAIATSVEAAYNGVVKAGIADRFQTDFRDASGIWNIEGAYDEVIFIWRGQLTQAYYTKDGQLFATSHAIETAALPAAAQHMISTSYNGYQVKDASVTERPGQASDYSVTLTGSGKTVKLGFTADGTVCAAL